jgi:3-hydroxyacyl-CoA dehydrogenase/enoyl-CoA hydratase/3-hydroxybutyryl-CoA epimerase
MSAMPVPAVPPSQRPAAIIRTETRHDGVAIITIDDPRETLNTIYPQFGAEITAAFDALEKDAKVVAIVLRSGKKDSFVAGAKIDFVRTIRFAQEAEDASREAARRFGAIAASKKPVVAAVHGAALGGGFELALACTATVASDDPKTQLGLPEVKLGLIPAANGLLRVAERAGYRVAIDLGLTGRSLRPAKALALGLVDDVVAAPILLETACSLALRLATHPAERAALERKRARGSATRFLLEKNPIGRAVLFRRARAETKKKTRGHYPAAERMLEELETHAHRGFRAAADVEARAFGDLVVSEGAHRMIELFFAQTALKKDTGLEANEDVAPRPVERVAVLGAGLMGAGIACVTVQAGLPVRMKDKDDLALGRGLKYVRDALDKRRSLSKLERDAMFARLSGTIDYTGIRRADIVIEAVLEDLDLKHAVVRDIEKLVSDTCVIASNTSSIPIAKIADAARRPERVLGMHYFSPVHRMPLLEVIRTPATDPAAVATAVALGKRQGKTVIVVRDGAGFYTTRILAPYLNEAAHLLAEGLAIDAVDRACIDWGFPVGPLQLLDEVGIDVAAHVQGVTGAAFGERMRPPSAFEKLHTDHRLGRKNGRGFYLYDRKRGRRVDDTVYGILGTTPKATVPAEEIQLRTALALVNEAVRCLDEGILRSARDGDVGAVFGIGFPPFRGGPFRYVDAVGADEILRRTRSLESRLGARFTPAPLLVEMARKGKRFYG